VLAFAVAAIAVAQASALGQIALRTYNRALHILLSLRRARLVTRSTKIPQTTIGQPGGPEQAASAVQCNTSLAATAVPPGFLTPCEGAC
jgi:hypothetical protein